MEVRKRDIFSTEVTNKLDISRIVSVSGVEMKVSAEHREEILRYFTTVMVPMIMESEVVIRFRLFEIDNAAVLEGASHETKSKEETFQYFSLVEFETEDYPWDVILDLAETEEWKRWFGDQNMVVCIDCLTGMKLAKRTTALAAESLFGQEGVLGRAQEWLSCA
jgi:hypothetical protein